MENYNSLSKIVDDTIAQAIQTQSFNIVDFVKKMEAEFTKLGFRENTMTTGGGGVESILLIRIDAMGDYILSTASIREIRMNYPFAYITLVIRKAIYPMAELCPYVNEVIAIDIPMTEGVPYVEGGIIATIKFIADFAKQHLWKRRYDLGFCLNYFVTPLKAILLYMSGARERVGYLGSMHWRYTDRFSENAPDIGHLMFTHTVINPKEIIWQTAQNLYLLKSYGLQVRSMDLELWYSAEDLYNGKKLLEGFAPNRIKIATVIGTSGSERLPFNEWLTNGAGRIYPINKWIVVFNKIIEEGGAIVILGGPAEIEVARFLESNLPSEYVKNFVEVKTGWRVDAAIISQMDMYIGNDTGACDIAAAAHLPIIIPQIFTNYTFFPPNTNVIAFKTENRSQNADGSYNISDIEPEEIVAAYEKMVYFIKDSGIRKMVTNSFIRTINQTAELKFMFEH